MAEYVFIAMIVFVVCMNQCLTEYENAAQIKGALIVAAFWPVFLCWALVELLAEWGME